MRKRIVIWIGILIVAIGSAALIGWERERSENDWTRTQTEAGKILTEKELAEHLRQLGDVGPTNPSVIAPLELKRPVRVAIGGLGFPDDEHNRNLIDLTLSKLTGAPGLDLVDRQSLDAVLHEMSLSLSGLTRAQDAIRVGKLLKADWFLLGTGAKIKGTNSVVVRLVDARTGILRDAGVFASDKPLVQLAEDLAAFTRHSRQNAASAKIPVFLAIGAFEDLSVNNRQPDFPTQLRGYLMAAYQGSSVTLLEREYVDVLLQELRLDLAGLTEESATNSVTPMQSAFWLVRGSYQSYETSDLQIELKLDVQRIFGVTRHAMVRGAPGEPVSRQIKQTIDGIIMAQNASPVLPTKNSEIRAQMTMGKELLQINPMMVALGSRYDHWQADQHPKRKRNLEEAARAFETVLLLDPGNHEAKMYLAVCLQSPVIDRLEDARNYYHEIIEDSVQDQWSTQAQQALIISFKDWQGRVENPEEKVRWLQAALKANTNSLAAEFYRKQAESAGEEAILVRGEGPKLEELAVKHLLENIRSFDNTLHNKPGTHSYDMRMAEYLKPFGADRVANARRLVELLPRLKTQFPELEPYLVATVVTFQEDTNAPVVQEFQQQLVQIVQHTNQVFAPEQYWDHIQKGVCPWAFKHKFYALSAQVMEGKRQAIAGGVSAIGGSKDEDGIELAFAYLGMKEWQRALDIFAGFSNQPVTMLTRGPWGEPLVPLLTGKLADFCRQKLGASASKDPREFDLGKPLFCLCAPSTFAVDESGLWIGISNQLLHLDFNLKTNVAVTLPKSADSPIYCLEIGATNIWVGTDGDGLIEFDKGTRECRRYTAKDGLLMDNIASLYLSADALWIGYGHRTYFNNGIGTPPEGGLGRLDLASRQFSAFTPSLSDKGLSPLEAADKPTRRPVIVIAEGAPGDLWLVVKDNVNRLRRYRVRDNTWEAGMQACSSLTTGQNHLFVGQYTNYLNDSHTGPLGINIFDLKNGQWSDLKESGGLPAGAASTLALEAHDLWVGGKGYIARVDFEHDKLLNFAYVQSPGVDKIQIGGSYVWAQFDWHLYRAPLNDLR